MADSGKVLRYALTRKGSRAVYLEPVIANDEKTAGLLLERALGQLIGEDVYLDFHIGFEMTRQILPQQGFVLQRTFVRMRYGAKTPPTSSLVFAIAGPEVG